MELLAIVGDDMILNPKKTEEPFMIIEEPTKKKHEPSSSEDMKRDMNI